MTDNNSGPSRRQVLAGLGTIGVASAGAGLGTTAFFSDRTTFRDNHLAAGALELKVDWQQTYNGPNPKTGVVEKHPVNAFPDFNNDGIRDFGFTDIFGVEFDDELYAVNPEALTASLITETGGDPGFSSTPNGLAFDPENLRLYYSINDEPNTGSELWFYDVISGSNTNAGTIAGEAAGAAWYDGAYWYIPNEKDNLNSVSIDPDGDVEDEETIFTALTDGNRQYRFGDIAITHDGLLYGSTLGSGVSTAEFFTIDIPGGASTYTELFTPDPDDWNGDPTGLQLGLDVMGTLWGHSTSSGEFVRIDPDGLTVEEQGTIGELQFTDLSSNNPCKRPKAEIPDAYQNDRYPDKQSLIELDDVKPGDKGKVCFSLLLCDNPGYIWFTGKAKEQFDTQLAKEIRVTVWLSDQCSPHTKYTKDSRPVFGGDGQSLHDLLELLQSAENGLPIDPQPDTGDVSCFEPLKSYCLCFKWELPTGIENVNELQQQKVNFDLGFYTEQCRHNDGPNSGDVNPTNPDLPE